MATFGKELLSRLTICVLCSRSSCNFGYFQFWFRGQDFSSGFPEHRQQHTVQHDMR